MISNTQSPTKSTLTLTLHRITRSREATDLLDLESATDLQQIWNILHRCSTIDEYMGEGYYKKLQDDIKEAIQ